MFEDLVNFGRIFDWITPSIAVIQDIFYGHPRDFGISADSTWGIREIKELFTFYDIPVWGLMYDLSGEMLRFSVQKKHADLAYYLLQQEGIPILYAPKVHKYSYIISYR